MQVQTAVIQVDGAHCSGLVVGHKLLGVDETGRVLVDLHAARGQPRIVAAGDRKDQLFIRDARRDDPHIHAPLGRQHQRPLHLVAQDQVGRGDVYIPLGAVDKVEVDILAHPLVVQRVVGVGQHSGSLPGGVADGRQIGLDGRHFFLRRTPHLQKNQRQIAHGVALQPHAGVLPAAVGVGQVEVFVRQIVAAGVADLPVNDSDLAVVAVVHKDVQHRHDGVEHPALDAPLLQLFGKGGVHKPDAAHVVVKNAHLYPGGGPLGQNILNALPGDGILDGVVLHKNKVLGFAQVGLLGLQRGVGVTVVGHIGVAAGGIVSLGLQVVDLVLQGRVLGHGGAVQRRGIVGLQLRIGAGEPPAHDVDRPAAPEQKIQADAKDGKGQNDNDPRKFGGAVGVAAVDAQRQQKRQHADGQLHPGVVAGQLQGGPHDPQHLQQHAQHSNAHAAHPVGDGLALFFGLV